MSCCFNGIGIDKGILLLFCLSPAPLSLTKKTLQEPVYAILIPSPTFIHYQSQNIYCCAKQLCYILSQIKDCCAQVY